MIGARIGARIGAVVSPKVGASDNPSSSAIAGVTRDAASGWYFPATATEWTTFRAAISYSPGNPVGLWLCQEASGNAADSIGANTLTANGTPLYQQTVSGFTRKGFGFTQVASQRFLSAGGPNPATGSVMWLAFVASGGVQGATRDIIVAATGANPLKLQATTTPKANVLDNATATPGGSTLITTLQPMVLKFDRTNTVCTAYTTQEKITTVYDATVVAASSGIGAGTGSGPLATIAYVAAFQTAAAEPTDAQVKILLNGMTGLVMPWS